MATSLSTFGPHLTHVFYGPSPQPKRHLNRFNHFCTDDCRVSVYFTLGRPSPSKLSLLMGDLDPPFNTWFLGPTRVLNPNGISIGAAVFTGRTSVTDRQTDRQTTLLGR